MSDKYEIGKNFQNQPFSRRLADGQSEMTPFFFDMEVLERYIREPRYDIFYNGIIGRIRLPVEADLSSLRDGDKISLEVFGTAYDLDWNRAVVTYLIYLSRLTPQHQLHWASKLSEGDFKVHPGFYKISIQGQFAEKLSIFEAIIEEMKVINELSNAVYGKPFFREVHEVNLLSRKLTLLIRPTRQEYHNFVLSLDKLISQNINKKFFDQGTRKLHDEKQKGTIILFEEWLRRTFACDPPELIPFIIETFKAIRKERQYPARELGDDEHSNLYFKKHSDLVFDAYDALAYLRDALISLPAAKTIRVNRFLVDNKIYRFI